MKQDLVNCRLILFILSILLKYPFDFLTRVTSNSNENFGQTRAKL